MCQPFVSLNEFNLQKVKAVYLKALLSRFTPVSCSSKFSLLLKYNEFSVYASKEAWLKFISSICEYNGLMFFYDKWSRDFDKWCKNKDYSICFL